MRLIILMVVAALLVPDSAQGQGYSLTLRSRLQSVSFRGVQADSVLAADVSISPDGSTFTADGFAARCSPGLPYCSYFRPGPKLVSGPVSQTARLNLWGFGVRGMDVSMDIRGLTDLGSDVEWPGTDPGLQLVEGFVRYRSRRVDIRAGRLQRFNRLGVIRYDGVSGELALGDVVRVFAYGGSGLANASLVPVTSSAFDPLDDFQPRSRQSTLGLAAGLNTRLADGNLEYLREVDPGSNKFVSERVATSWNVHPARGLGLTVGADYDLAQGWLGSVDAALRVAPFRWFGGTIGVRRYRPHFDLWTIWGAFSPVPYRAAFGSSFLVAGRVTLTASGEVYEYDVTQTSTPLLDVERNGWRARTTIGYAVSDAASVSLTHDAGFGPGASSRAVRGSVRLAPENGWLAASTEAGTILRPLEFRFGESSTWFVKAGVLLRPSNDFLLDLSLTRYDETRRRPDAGRLDWSNLRFQLSVELHFSSIRSLPNPVLLIPEDPSR